MAQLSPKELFINFSNDFCDTAIEWGSRKLFWGKGAAYDFEGFIQLLKTLPHSCMSQYVINVSRSGNETLKKAFSKFVGSGKGKIALPYKFLQILDPDAFKEIQQNQYASIAHAIRNAADISRACKIFWDSRSHPDNSLMYTWEGRGAVEPIYHYAYNSLVKGLIFIGPNILLLSEANNRWNGCNKHTTNPYGSQLPCVTTLFGAKHECVCPEIEPGVPGACPPTKKVCTIIDTCKDVSGCDKKAECAEEPIPNIDLYNLHTGYFVRKSYAGYGNFISNGNFFGCQDDSIFKNYSRTNNNFNYQEATYDMLSKFRVHRTREETVNANAQQPPKIKRAKHITQAQTVDEIKDFLYNGYGIVLSTNVGFSDKRDSIGIAYPDRIWYHTMAIVGYDDTRRIYPEALYLFANSWGNWNYGGHPDWGPIPEGSFLVTESHLKCILTLPRVDKFNDCNKTYQRPCRELTLDDITFDFNRPPTSVIGAIDVSNDGFYSWIFDRSRETRWVRVKCDGKTATYVSEKRCNMDKVKELKDSENCGDNCEPMTACDYIGCTKNQSPWGIAFAISFDEEIPYSHKDMRYQQFFAAKPYKEQVS